MNVAEVTREELARHVDDVFEVSAGEAIAFEAHLVEVSPMGSTVGPTGRSPFSAVLRGPANEAPEQAIYQVRHPELGSFELFLVPIGPDDEGMKYEAVFT